MRKLLSKVSTVLRIGYCILIIYIPILRYGNCKKVSTNGILHCLLPGSKKTSKKGRIPFLIKVFFQTTYWHVRNGKRGRDILHTKIPGMYQSIFEREVLEPRLLFNMVDCLTYLHYQIAPFN